MACGKSIGNQKKGDTDSHHTDHMCCDCVGLEDGTCAEICMNAGECYWEKRE